MTPSIQDIRSRIKALLGDETLFTAVLVVLVGIGSFGLGRSSVAEMKVSLPVAEVVVSEEKKTALPPAEAAPAAVSAATAAQSGEVQYVGSKNGTKFHLPTCPGAAQIKEENKVYFTSKQDAYSKGYTEASNCKGI